MYTNGTVKHNGNGHHNEEEIVQVPHDPQAEQAVLGSALIDPEAAELLPTLLSPADFYRERNRFVAEAIFSLVKSGSVVDFVTVQSELERQDHLDEVGGPAYIIDLINHTPTALYVRHYAGIVARCAANRNHIAYAQAVAELAFQNLDEAEMTAKRRELEKKYLAPKTVQADGIVPLSKALRKTLDRLEDRQRRAGEEKPAFWPWPSFQANIGEPYRGVLHQVVGDDGSGKTAFLECLADYLSGELGYRGAFIVMDMSEELMDDRRTSRHATLTLDQLKEGNFTDEEAVRLMEASDRLDKWEDRIHYVYMHGAHVDQVVQTIEYLAATVGLDYVMIDNMRNLADLASPRQMLMRMGDNRRVSDNMTQIAAVVGTLNLWGFVINQLNKTGKGAVGPDNMSKNDVEGSGNQTNVVRYQYNLWRGYAEDDEWMDTGDGKAIKIASAGDRSRYLHVKATKVTAGSEFKCRLLTELQYSRMIEPVEIEDEELYSYDD